MQELKLEDRAPDDPLRLSFAPTPDGADVDGVLGATTLTYNLKLVCLLTHSLSADKYTDLHSICSGRRACLWRRA
jgi:hypothetical protein